MHSLMLNVEEMHVCLMFGKIRRSSAVNLTR
jgi:hypothetical protein